MINCVVAVEQGQGIGFNGHMPWPRLKGDMQWFKDITTDNIIIMGSTTWKSLGKPLPNRINVVISSQLQTGANFTYENPIDAISDLKERFSRKEIYIIGGQALYDSVKELIDIFYVTELEQAYPCDKFFNLDYVKTSCTSVREVLNFEATDTTPAYIIKEYKK